MGTTLRNIVVLLFFAVLAAKGVEHFADLAPTGSDERSRAAAGHNSAAYQADESYSAHDELVLRAGRNGHFMVEASVDGTPIDFMVDTGASTVVLSPQDASLVGLNPNTLHYNAVFETGNGRTPVALITLDELSIGPLDLYDVQAAVIPKPMSQSLLGMSALERLAGYEVDGDRMILRW